MRTNRPRTGGAPALTTTAFLLLALALWQPGEARAQWTTPDANNNIHNTNAGNVGVGTNGEAPPAPLTVKSDTNVMPLLVRGSNPNAVSFAVLNDQAGSKGWAFQVAGPNYLGGAPNGTFIVRQATDNINAMAVSPAGNVGIGTAAPGYLLTVNGASAFGTGGVGANGSRLFASAANANPGVDVGLLGANMFFSGATRTRREHTATAWGFQFNTTTSLANSAALLIHHDASGAETLPLAVLGTGNVGIGTATPLYSLDINGGVNGFRAKAATTSGADAVAVFENGSGIQAVIRGNGNVGIGTTSPSTKLHVAGDVTVDGNISAKYQDVAEWVPSSQKLSAGTVVVLDPERSNHVLASASAYDTRVAGVVSAQPGVLLGEGGEGRLMVATTGRVRVKVDATRAPIRIGDLLVTGEVGGMAMKSEPVNVGGRQMHSPGTIIGKALEPLEKGTGEILVLLSLQ